MATHAPAWRLASASLSRPMGKTAMTTFMILMFLLSVQVQRASSASQGASATFDDDEDDEVNVAPEPRRAQEQQRAPTPPTLETKRGAFEPDEEEFIFDEDEFEGFEGVSTRQDAPKDPEPQSKKKQARTPPPGAKGHVPRPKKELIEYYPEGMAVAFLFLFFLNYLYGRGVNTRLADKWLKTCNDILNENFAMVGVDSSGVMMRESANELMLYCSGRLNCESVMITLNLKPRQDLYSTVWDLLKPQIGGDNQDTVTVDVTLGSGPETGGNTEKYCFAVMPKNEEVKVRSEHDDLNEGGMRKWKTGLHESLCCTAEDEEVVRELLPEVVIPALNDNRQYIKLIHFSDRMETSSGRQRKGGLKFVFNLLPVDRHAAKDGGKDKTVEEKLRVGEILLRIALRYIDKATSTQLSGPARERIKKVQAMQRESEFKKTRSQREAEAQQRKMDKLKAEKAALENMSPQAAAKAEEKLLKKQRKNNAPVRAMKIK